MSSTGLIYKITLLNFRKHNSGLKKGHKHTLIANNFFEDAKVQTLSVHTQHLLLRLILTCGDLCRDTVELSSKRLRTMFECNRNIDGALNQLQELQILSYEKIELFLNRKEEKRKEEKRKEVGEVELVKLEPSPPEQPASQPSKFDAENLDEVLSSLGEEKANAWRELYNHDEEFILRELRKAWQYYALDNPSKKPKSRRGWSQCLSSWLERGWSYRSKTIAGQQTKTQARNTKSREVLQMIEDGEL